MYPVERRKAILEILEKNNSASVDELSKALFTGTATVRRDLDKMAKEGIITRTHGGAVRLQSGNVEIPYAIRESENGRAKEDVATLASELVSDGQAVFFDGSTTVMRMIPKIALRKGLKVVTNGARTAFELSQSGIYTVCTGGVSYGASASLTGGDALRTVERFNAEWFFFSCRGFTRTNGIGESSIEVADVKAAMASRAKKTVLLVDGSKIGKTALCSLDLTPDFVITDGGIERSWREELEKRGTKILLV